MIRIRNSFAGAYRLGFRKEGGGASRDRDAEGIEGDTRYEGVDRCPPRHKGEAILFLEMQHFGEFLCVFNTI